MESPLPYDGTFVVNSNGIAKATPSVSRPIKRMPIQEVAKRKAEVAAVQSNLLPPNAEGTPSTNATQAPIVVNVNTSPTSTTPEVTVSQPTGDGATTTTTTTTTIDSSTNPRTRIKKITNDKGRVIAIEYQRKGHDGKLYTYMKKEYPDKAGRNAPINTETYEDPSLPEGYDADAEERKKQRQIRAERREEKRLVRQQIREEKAEQKRAEQLAEIPKLLGGALTDTAQNLYGPETIGYTLGVVGAGLLSNPATAPLGAILGVGGTAWQAHETLKKIKKQAKKEKLENINEANQWNFDNFNSTVALNQLRSAMSTINQKKQWQALKKAYEKRSLQNKYDAMQDASMRALHNKKQEAIEIQKAIDDHLWQNYRMAKEKQEKRTLEEASKNNYAPSDPNKMDMGKLAKEVGGPLGEALSYLDYIQRRAPNYNPNADKGIFSDEALADQIYDRDLNKAAYLMNYSPDEITFTDREEANRAFNNPEYIQSSRAEGPSVWSHPDEIQEAMSKHDMKNEVFWNKVKIGKDFLGNAMDIISGLLPNGPSAMLSKAAELLKSDKSMDEKIKELVYGDMKSRIEDMASKYSKYQKNYQKQYDENKEIIKNAEKVFGLIEKAKIENWHKEKIFTEDFRYNSEDEAAFKDKLGYLKDWLMFLHGKGDNRNEWLNYIQQEEKEQTTPNLVANNDERRKWLRALKSIASTQDPIKDETDIENNAKARVLLQNEFDNPYFNFNGLDDGNWIKQVGKAFITNDADTKKLLETRGIKSMEDIQKRRSIIREKALMDDVQPEQMDQYVNQAMLLPEKDFDEDIVKSIVKWKKEKGIDVGTNLLNLAEETVRAWKNQKELKKHYNQDRLISSLKQFDADRNGSYARFRKRLIKKDLIDEYGKGKFNDKELLELDPKVHEADARRNHWLNAAHNIISSFGWGDAAENEELLNDPDVKSAFESNHITLGPYNNRWVYIPLWEAKAHEDPKDFEYNQDQLIKLHKAVKNFWIKKGKNPRYRFFNAHEFNAGEVDSTIKTTAEIQRDFLNDYLNKKFTDANYDPVVRRYRAEQKAAVLHGFKRHGKLFTEILDGMSSLDNIRPEKIREIADDLSDYDVRYKKHLREQAGRIQYGREIFADETQRAKNARSKYKKSKDFRDNLVKQTPILVNAVDPKTGEINPDKFENDAYDLFYRSAKPYDSNNKYHKKVYAQTRMEDFPDEGKAVPHPTLPGVVLMTRKEANGKKRYFAQYGEKETYLMDFPINDMESPKIQDKADYAKRTLKNNAVNISRNEVQKAISLQRANNEVKIEEAAKVNENSDEMISAKRRKKMDKQRRSKQPLKAPKVQPPAQDPSIAAQRAAIEIQIKKKAKEPIVNDFERYSMTKPPSFAEKAKNMTHTLVHKVRSASVNTLQRMRRSSVDNSIDTMNKAVEKEITKIANGARLHPEQGLSIEPVELSHVSDPSDASDVSDASE